MNDEPLLYPPLIESLIFISGKYFIAGNLITGFVCIEHRKKKLSFDIFIIYNVHVQCDNNLQRHSAWLIIDAPLFCPLFRLPLILDSPSPLSPLIPAPLPDTPTSLKSPPLRFRQQPPPEIPLPQRRRRRRRRITHSDRRSYRNHRSVSMLEFRAVHRNPGPPYKSLWRASSIPYVLK